MRTLVGVLLAVSLLVAGCGDDDGDADADIADDVTFTDDGTRFEVAGGEEFVVVLESNATTGFAWVPEVELDPGVVELVDDTYVAPDSDLVGAPGRQELTFRAVGEGSTFVSLWYVRPFDDPPEPAGRAQYEVIVGSGVPPDADEPSDGDEPQPPIPDDEDVSSVADLLADEPTGDVVVRGLLFDDGSGLVLCDALAESFPPQCPGDGVEIANPDAVDVDLTVEGGVRWSERPVVVLGRLAGGLLEVEVAGSVG